MLAFIIAELGARALGPPYEIGDQIHRTHQCEATIGWTGLPSQTAVISMYNRTYPVSWNRDGMRGPDYPYPKAAGVFRILVLGDSMIEAMEVAEAERSVHILEQKLNEQAPPGLKFEVLNGAIGAWGPPPEFMYFRTKGQLYQPDLVLISWFSRNDLTDVLPNHVNTAGPTGGIHCFSPYFAICNGEFDSQPWFVAPGVSAKWQACTQGRRWLTNGLSTLYEYSRLYQRLTAVLVNINDRDTFATNQYAPWLDVHHQDEKLNEAYQLTGDIYAQLAQEAAVGGAKTVAILAPLRRSVDAEVNPMTRAAMIAADPALAQADPTLPHRVMSELLTAEGMPVLDLHPLLVNYLKVGGEPVYWPGQDFHWNVQGNQWVGETIALWLIEQKLVPSR